MLMLFNGEFHLYQVMKYCLNKRTRKNEKGRIYTSRLERRNIYLGEHNEALTYCKKAVVIQKQSFSLNYSDLLIIYKLSN